MNDVERFERMIDNERDLASEIAKLYGLDSEDIFCIMYDTVKGGMMTFNGLSTVLKKIYIPEFDMFDICWLCEKIRRISRRGIKIDETTPILRELTKESKDSS